MKYYDCTNSLFPIASTKIVRKSLSKEEQWQEWGDLT